MIVKGDDKYYQLRIRASRNDRYVYTKKFFAKSDWQEIRIPLESMEPYFRGQRLNKNNFNKIIQKQTNHLINEISRSELIDDKLIGCAAIILVGLCYQNEKKYLFFGSGLLKKISKLILDNYGLPKSSRYRC